MRKRTLKTIQMSKTFGGSDPVRIAGRVSGPEAGTGAGRPWEGWAHWILRTVRTGLSGLTHHTRDCLGTVDSLDSLYCLY